MAHSRSHSHSRKHKSKKTALCTKKGRKRSTKRLTSNGAAKRKTMWIKWLWAYYCAAQKAEGNSPGLYKSCMERASPYYKKNIKDKKFTEHELAEMARKVVSK